MTKVSETLSWRNKERTIIITVENQDRNCVCCICNEEHYEQYLVTYVMKMVIEIKISSQVDGEHKKIF